MKTILLVDDEYGLVESLTELLEDDGYRVVSAVNGKEGLARLQAEKLDLVVTDHMMPIADGRELAKGMRALPELGSIPVIMMTAAIEAVALSDGGGTLEVSAFLRKPFAFERLLEAIVRLIGSGEKPAGA